jgi:hypothetical protein
MPDLSGRDQLLHTGHLYRFGYPPIHAVDLVEVNAIGIKPTKARTRGGSQSVRCE